MKYLARSLALTLTLGFSAPIAAQEAQAAPALEESTDREARALFDAGSVAFSEGRYESALRHFENAYALSPRPGMLFNIATTYDRMHRDAEALAHFRRYLAQAANAANRAEVEARIEELEAEAATVTPTTAPSSTTPSTEAPAGGVDAAPIALLVSGGALILGGVTTLVFGLMDASAVESAVDVPYSDIRAQYERAPILEGVGGAALGVGVALVLVGGLTWSLSDSDGGSHGSPQVSLTPTGLQVRGTF